MKKDNYIYIVLIRALTKLGKFSRLISKYEYTHIAVSLSEELNDFITFSRKKHNTPFDAGFMHELKEHYVFGNNDKVKIKVFKIPVSNDNLSKIKEYIKSIEEDTSYIFNLYSMITMPIIHGFKIYKAHNCMSFTSKIIELTNQVKLNKKYYKYNIKELDILLTPYFYKEEYITKEKDDKKYMSRVSILTNIKFFFKLNGKLIYRMIFKNQGL